ncbi:MAG: DUF2339 domain-containing protein [Gammaproteobacteria bacterium]
MEPTNDQDQIKKINERLDRIEKLLNISQPSAKEKDPWVTPNVETTSLPQSKKEFKALNWLGIIAVICFILAATFIIKLSIDSGWLTPVRQIGLAIVFGFSLIGVGITLLKTDKEYASLLPATGIVVFYLSALAANSYYFLISYQAALLIFILISVLCLYLYKKIKLEIYSITAAVGAYLAPLLLVFDRTHGSSVISFIDLFDFTSSHTSVMRMDFVITFYYLLLCSFTFVYGSILLSSRILMATAAYLAVAVNGWLGWSYALNELAAFVLAINFLVFAVGVFLYSKYSSHKVLDENESMIYLVVLILFYALEYYFIDKVYPAFAPWISLGFAAFLISLYLIAKKVFQTGTLQSYKLIVIFTTIVVFHAVYLELLPKDFLPWLFVLFMLSFALAPISVDTIEFKKIYRFPMLAILTIILIEYVSMLDRLIFDYNPHWLLVSLCSLASIWFLLIYKPSFVRDHTDRGYTILTAAHLLAISGFYRLVTDYGLLAVSASWLFYASCVLLFGFYRKDKVITHSALFVLALAAGKALLYDVSQASTVIRILCLLLTGIVLYGAGFLMRKISLWEK